jgi:hypothetical protein
VSVAVVKGEAVAQKRMRMEVVDDESRREAYILGSIVHLHVSLDL